MEKTGQLLKTEREKQNLTISEVSLATKINPKVLQYIEEGRAEDLPPKSFVRGFVRSYAKYLKMDLDMVLNTFQEEMGPTIPNPSDTVGASEKFPKRTPFLSDSAITSKTLAVVGILFLIGLIIGIKNVIEKYERERIVGEPPENVVSIAETETQTTSSTEESTTAANETTGDENKKSDEKSAEATDENKDAKEEARNNKETVEKSDKTVVAATPTPTNTPAQPNAEEKKVEKTEVKKDEEKKPETPPAVTAQTTPPPAAANTPPAKPATPPAPASVPAKPETTAEAGAGVAPTSNGGPQEVILEALDKVTLSFRIDGGKTQKVTLNPEQIHTIKAQTAIALDLTDGGAVNIIHNGRDRGVPGDLGKAIKVKFP